MDLSKTKDFIYTHCFENIPPLIDDCMPVGCKFCGKSAWIADTIVHKRNCEVRKVLKEIDEAEDKSK